MHLAASEKQTEIFKLLLKNGADIKQKDNEGLTSLHHASFGGNSEIVKVIITSEIGIYSKVAFVFKNDSKKISFFIPDVNETDKNGVTPLQKACFSGHNDVIRLLLEKGAVVDVEEGQASPLHHAAYGGFQETVELLLTKKPNVNSRDAEKATPLHKAAYNGNVDIVKMLIKHGAMVIKQ